MSYVRWPKRGRREPSGQFDETSRRISIRSASLIALASFTPALTLMARSLVGVPHPERLVVISVVAWIIGLAICSLAVRLGLSENVSTAISISVLVALFWGGLLMRLMGDVAGGSVVGLVLLLVILLFIRVEHDFLALGLTTAMCVALVVGVSVELVTSMSAYGELAVSPTEDADVLLTERPDVFVVFFDGFPGIQAIESDFGEQTRDALVADLEASGMAVPESVWAAYWSTQFSMTSFLDMGHPSPDYQDNKANVLALYQMVGGSNRLVGLLEQNGYDSYMIESSWSGSSCGPEFDRCIASPWLDEAMFFLMSRSLLKEWVLSTFGYSFTAGTQSTMQWLQENARTLAADGEPTFVFAHVMAPHPPFFLDEGCGRVVTDSRSGVTFRRNGVDDSVRDGYLREQIRCLQGFMTDLRDEVGDNTILVLVSDHGTDRRNQLVRDPSTWTEVDHLERYNAFLAVSGPACPVGDHLTLPNVMRHVLSCHSSEGIPDVPDLIFGGSETVTLGEAEDIFASR